MPYQNIDRTLDIATEVHAQIYEQEITNTPLPEEYHQACQRRLHGLVVSVGQVANWTICGRSVCCKITFAEPNQRSVKIDRQKTRIQTKSHNLSEPFSEEERKDIYLTSLADMIQSSFENLVAFKQLGIPVAKSVLIHGVAGVGKSRLVRRVAASLGSAIYELSSYDLLSFADEEFDNAEFSHYNPLHLIVKEATKNSPAIIVIRDLDLLGPSGDKSKKIVDVFAREINKINDTDPVCIVGLARSLQSIPESLRKTDIFRQHMTLPIPSLPQRKVLLTQLLEDLPLQKPSTFLVESKSEIIEYYATQISMRTSGYVVRDLKLLIRQAKLKSLRSSNEKEDIADRLEQLSLTSSSKTDRLLQWSDFEYAIDNYRPSQRTEVESTLPKRDWAEMGGYKVIKDRMKQAILLPLLKPEVFTKLGIKPPSGLLLYGPSGCGKTALVQALVSESMMNVISIKGPEIFSKYLGETENKLRKLFATAKRISPCIVFIDEMDAIGTKRGFDANDGGGGGVNERVLSTLLNEMDGVEGRQGVVVIGCTNRPDQIDDAIIRPGRLDQLVYVGLPTLKDRIDIINTLMRKVRVSDDVDPVALAKQTEFCSGADLENLFREAGTAALRKDVNVKEISDDHIQTVILPICERAEDQILEGRLDVYEKFLHDHTL